MMKRMAQPHNRSIAFLKGICIVLMVIGHSGCGHLLGSFIYLFHMPCFFFASGYLFKDNYLSNPLQYISRRIRGLWWKFVEYSFVFLLFHHLFYKLNIYSQDYSFDDYKRMSFHIFTLTRTEQLLGGYWFLKDLLYGSLIGFCLLKIEGFFLNHFPIKRRYILSFGILLLALLIAGAIIYFPFHIPTIGTHAFLACTFYLSGVFAHRYDIMKKMLTFRIALVCLIVLVTISLFYHGSMSAIGKDAVFYYFSALFGILWVNYCANKISTIKNHFCRLIDRMLNYIGTKTFHILTFHFLGFKLVTAVIILFSDKYSIIDMASFPVLSADMSGLWIVYTVVSISFSLIVSCLFDKATIWAKCLFARISDKR